MKNNTFHKVIRNEYQNNTSTKINTNYIYIYNIPCLKKYINNI